MAATVEHSLRRLPQRPYRHVLDVGCGTGAFLTALAARLPRARLVGVDLSLPMLAAARAKRIANAVLCRARAEALPLAGGRFDLAVSLSAFHDFDDLELAMREIRRVLRPGGAILVTDWCGDYLASRLLGRLATLRRGGGFTVPDTAHWHSLLERAGFCDIRLERYRTGGFWGLMTAGALKPGRSE